MRCLAALVLIIGLSQAQRYDHGKLYPGTEEKGSELWNEMESLINEVATAIHNTDVAGFMKHITEHSWTMAPGQVGVVGINDNEKFYTQQWGVHNISWTDTVMDECGHDYGDNIYSWSRGFMQYNGMKATYAVIWEHLEEDAPWTINLLAWTFHGNNSEDLLTQFWTQTAIEVAMAAGQEITDASQVLEQYRGTIVDKNNTIYKGMYNVAMDLTWGINDQDYPLTIELYHDHSWVYPPAHIGVLGIEETSDFIYVLFKAGTIILETTLFEVGGNELFAWARGSTRVNHFKSLFLISCERICGPNDHTNGGVWRTNLLAWAISADNPLPAFKAVLEQEKKKAAAEAEIKAEKDNEGFSFTRV